MKKQIEVISFEENEDGSATLVVDMDYDTLLLFAKKGLLSTLTEAANKIVEENKSDEP